MDSIHVPTESKIRNKLKKDLQRGDQPEATDSLQICGAVRDAPDDRIQWAIHIDLARVQI